MRPSDILSLSLWALYQQKLRTLLTTLGVAGGCFVLVFTLAMGRGVQETIVREYSRYAGLRQIDVHPNYQPPTTAEDTEKIEVPGVMSAEKRGRLRQEILRHGTRNREPTAVTRLTPDCLRRLREIPHVKAVVPAVDLAARAALGDRLEDVAVHSAPPDNQHLRARVISGDFLSETTGDAAVVTEYLLYRLGVTDDAAVSGTLGRKIRLEYRTGGYKPHLLLSLFNANRAQVAPAEQDLLDKVIRQLPTALDSLDLSSAEKDFLKKILRPPPEVPRPSSDVAVAREFTIVGVLRGATKDDPREYLDWWTDTVDVVLPVQTATDFFFEAPGFREAGVQRTLVEADRPDDVKEVARQITALGLRANSLVEMIERDQFTYLLLFGVMTCVALVALAVAALGIINTMLMTVLERTREIGVMMAVGANHRHIQAIFLIEGAVIGLFGGLLGLAAAKAVSLPGDAWIRSLAVSRLKIELHDSLFVWPLWLAAGGPLFAILVTTLAAVYPARRAARVNPVVALRHE